ncbi:type II secretion system protein GspN [Desulfobacterales bacterium HSG2]|nr:type II secretion system protein GspN [Desulfobacterales bacterium HSG2]
MKKWLLYSIYIIAASAFFIYWLFPSDMITDYIIRKADESNPDLTITIDRVKPNFPPGLKFYDVSLSNKESPAIDAEWIKVVPKFLTLFSDQKTFSFKGRTCEGNLEGEATITESETGPRMTVDADLAGILMKDIHAIQDPSKYKLSGILDGKITYTREKANEAVINAKLTASDANFEVLGSVFSKLGLLASLFDAGNYTFKSIDADLEIKNKKKFEIRECVLKGNQLGGNISGSVELRTPRGRSTLNLKGTIRPHPSFLAKLGSLASQFFKGKGNENGRPFKIRGTFDNPRFR